MSKKSIEFNCDNCGSLSSSSKSKYEKREKHFCCNECYLDFRKNPKPLNRFSPIEGKNVEIDGQNIENNHPELEIISRLRKRFNGRIVREELVSFGHGNAFKQIYGHQLTDEELLSYWDVKQKIDKEEAEQKRNKFKCLQKMELGSK